MKKIFQFTVLTSLFLLIQTAVLAQQFTLEQIRSNPFPTGLTAAANGSRIAWVFNERGVRNVFVAEGPDFSPRKLTNYTDDDGQELVNLAISPDGRYVVYVRGGNDGANWADAPPNPASSPSAPKVQMFSVPFVGGEPKALTEANNPVISPRSDVVAFARDGVIMTVPLDGSAAAKRIIASRGTSGSPEWSPDGRRLAFVSVRNEHSFIGVFTNESTPIRWLQPSTGRDSSPRWSPDGKSITFIRRPGAAGEPEPALTPSVNPWAIWTADASTGLGKKIWSSPNTPRGSFPTTHGQTNLNWAANGRITFLSYMDGHPHLYSISENGGEPMLLTPGRYMAEFIRLSPDRRFLIFAGNTGPDPDDIDRRHLVRVPVDKATPEVLTPGAGSEWNPSFTGDGRLIVFTGAGFGRPPLPAVMSSDGKGQRWIGEDRVPRDFPASKLVKPKHLVITAADGVKVHCQLFEAPGGPAKKPAVVYVHGGPPRQMLVTWNYSEYYSNVYAVNQYLASRGFVVLSVNYRLGIGYGYEFHNPPRAGWRGASEYQDVKAGGEYLQRLPGVDAKRMGIYGGSYGGFLTAMALARNSDIFAAGVDLHGVHNWTAPRSGANLLFTGRDSYETPPDLVLAQKTAWASSPVSSIKTWRSPVLLIHGDDDRNVRFGQTVDLVARLEKAKVPYEELVLPDEVHSFLKHSSWLKANATTVDFLEKYLKPMP